MLQVECATIVPQAGATLSSLLGHAQDLVAKLRALQFDQREFVCLKFLVLFSLGKEPRAGRMPAAGCLQVCSAFCRTEIVAFCASHAPLQRERVCWPVCLSRHPAAGGQGVETGVTGSGPGFSSFMAVMSRQHP